MRLSLVPKEQDYFRMFSELAANLDAAAQLLVKFMDDGNRKSIAAAILEHEHVGDKIVHDIVRRLNKSFITPIDREDIYDLVATTDEILDSIEEVTGKVHDLPRRGDHARSPAAGAGHRQGHADPARVHGQPREAQGPRRAHHRHQQPRERRRPHRARSPGAASSRATRSAPTSSSGKTSTRRSSAPSTSASTSPTSSRASCSSTTDLSAGRGPPHRDRRPGARLRLHQRLPRHRQRDRHLGVDARALAAHRRPHGRRPQPARRARLHQRRQDRRQGHRQHRPGHAAGSSSRRSSAPWSGTSRPGTSASRRARRRRCSAVSSAR